MEDIIGKFTGLVVVTLLFGAPPAAIVLIYYFARRSKHAERLALIEKGVDPSVYMNEQSSSYLALMWGLLLVGIGLGAFLGYILSDYAYMEAGFVVPTLALIFGGLGLIGFFFYRKKWEPKTAG